MPLTHFIFPATITLDEHGWWQVRFADLPDALTSGETREEALREAEDCLTMALYARIEAGETIPRPSPVKPGTIGITPDPEVCLKAALSAAMHEQSVTADELARRLGTDQKEARHIINPGYKTRLPRMTRALQVMGKQVVIGISGGASI